MNKRLLPAYPIFVKDPYFSFWANTEDLNASNLIFWGGHKKEFFGFLKIDGEIYQFLGNYGTANKMSQTDLSVSAYTTDYEFVNDDVTLKVSFVSPLPLDDMMTLSCPVCYFNYEILSNNKHEYEISMFVGETVCYNNGDKRADTAKGVVGGVFDLDNFETAFMGLNKQKPLSLTEDDACSEWGYYYVTGEKSYITTTNGLRDYVAGLISSENLPYLNNEEHQTTNQLTYICGVNTAKAGKILFAYDDTVACKYYGKFVYDYYYKDNKTIIDALKETFENSAKIDAHLNELDKDLAKKAEKFGEEYVNIVYASLRQSIAMHKLTLDTEGNVLFMSRESDSNSCIATVDVSYPSIPLYLLYDTEYVKGMMRPIFKFAKMPVWTYDFAPHDGGQYPNCDGQVYGLAKNDNRYIASRESWTYGQMRTRSQVYMYPANSNAFVFEKQMPVEECANMIIMTAACYDRDKKLDFVKEN